MVVHGIFRHYQDLYSIIQLSALIIRLYPNYPDYAGTFGISWAARQQAEEGHEVDLFVHDPIAKTCEDHSLFTTLHTSSFDICIHLHQSS